MSGKHEPPTNRSFYFSLATSTLRFVIIAALVVGGVFVINRAFVGEVPTAPPSGGGSTGPTSPPTPSPTKPPKEEPSPAVVGVHIAVFNGTEVTGLAGDTADTLQKEYGYVIDDVGDAPNKPVPTTTLYFRAPKDKVEAEFLADDFFKGIDVTVERLPSGSDVQRSVQVSIVLGNDYATAQ